MGRAGLIAALGLIVGGGQAAAETPRVAVVSAGADAGMLAQGYSMSPLQTGLVGYFARLSWEGLPPEYPTVAKGYLWRGALVPDVGFSRAWSSEGQRFSTAAVGLRGDLLFSQKRMGLLEVSARGGLWLAARAGVAMLDSGRRNRRSLRDDGDGIGVVAEDAAQTSPEVLERNSTGMIYDFAFGAHFLLGDTGLRFEYELDVFVVEDDVAEQAGGMRLRVGFGAYF